MTTTTRVRVLDLLGTEVAGIRAQVRTRYDWAAWSPMWRTLKGVRRLASGGVEFVRIDWDPEGRTPDGWIDCGFSGRATSIADDWEIEVEA